MNRHAYRIVFNPARGCLMAVAECATACGKRASGERGARRGPVLAPMLAGVALMGALAGPAWSQTMATRIVADSRAPRTQQATVLNAANGVVQVDIQTPSAAGVSRNIYAGFDVGGRARS